MIGARNTRSQKYMVGVIQANPGTPVSEEIADSFRNYDIDILGWLTRLQWKTVCDYFANIVSRLDTHWMSPYPYFITVKMFWSLYHFLYYLKLQDHRKFLSLHSKFRAWYEKMHFVTQDMLRAMVTKMLVARSNWSDISTGFNGETERPNS